MSEPNKWQSADDVSDQVAAFVTRDHTPLPQLLAGLLLGLLRILEMERDSPRPASLQLLHNASVNALRTIMGAPGRDRVRQICGDVPQPTSAPKANVMAAARGFSSHAKARR
jgi:hypothetical protein